MKDFHCCATCIHFLSNKTNIGMQYTCKRLGFQTDPSFKFNCWSPKENVRRLIEKERDNKSRSTI